LDDRLEGAEVDVAAGKLAAIGLNLEIASARHAIGKGGARAWNAFDGGLHSETDAVDDLEVVAGDLDADGCADAGRDHVHADLDRVAPRIDEAGHARAAVELVGDPLDG